MPLVLEHVAHVLLHTAIHSLPDWVKPLEHPQMLGLVVGLVTTAPVTQDVHPLELSHVLHKELQLALQENVVESYAKPSLQVQLELLNVAMSLQLRQLAPLSELHVLQSPWHIATHAPLLKVKPCLHSQFLVLPDIS